MGRRSPAMLCLLQLTKMQLQLVPLDRLPGCLILLRGARCPDKMRPAPKPTCLDPFSSPPRARRAPADPVRHPGPRCVQEPSLRHLHHFWRGQDRGPERTGAGLSS